MATNPNTTPEQGGMTWGDVMNLWVKAGGNPQAAAMAAAVADASSGLNPGATFSDDNGRKYKGLWMVGDNQGGLFTSDPLASARAAIQLSNNGTDWSSWCSTWSDNDCGNSGGNYLEDGANAVASLKLRGGHFMVDPNSGQPLIEDIATAEKQAQSIAAANSGQGSSPVSGKGAIALVAIILLIVIVVVVRNRGKGRKKAPENPAPKDE